MIKHITVHLTNRCNLRCRYCHIDAGNYDEDSVLSMEACKNIFIDSIQSVSIAGGEPFYDKERLYAFLDVIPKKIKDIAITTNGLLVNEEDLYYMHKRCIRLQISVDGGKNEHEYNRGNNTYEKTIKTIVDAVSKGVRVDVLTTVSRTNKDSILEHIGFMDAIGVTNLTLLHFTPKGRGEGAPEEETHRIEWVLFQNELREKIGTKNMRVWIQPRFSTYNQLLDSERVRGINVCNMYKLEYAYVDIVDGNVYPCGLAYGTPLKMGNFRKQSLYEIISTVQKQNECPDECKECNKVNLCKGGAKCYSWLIHGDLEKKDPYCKNDNIIPICPFPAIKISGPEMKTIQPTIV